MPFGAEPLGQGRSRFRLWAPSAREVTLVLDAPARVAPMEARGEGWWERIEAAPPGTRYRYRLDGGLEVPDPASRFNPEGLPGSSEVIDPDAFEWEDGAWSGRRWEEAVLYELHVGTFTAEGTFAGVRSRLDYLAQLGATAIELMPIAGFPGRRGWGYDGVLPFAPHAPYGRPEELKELIVAAHTRGLMVFLDIVYSHFGPAGNHLHAYAPRFFHERDSTPWGAAINFDGPDSRPVRDFFIHNALYWIEEYHMDGLRLDAAHAIRDDSRPDILTELAAAVQAGPGRARPIHLVLENDRNQARYLERAPDGTARHYDAQWNDDAHHACHVLLTGETDGYYADYAQDAERHLGRCLAEGYAYQGEPSGYRGGRGRGEPSAHLPPAAFVSYLQNHDQVGNRAHGERLAALADESALRAATVAWLLAPSPPLIFMGEEFGARTPFLFFCDFPGELAAAVTEGRRREFARFARFADPAAQAAIPDPNDPRTFECCRLDWSSLDRAPHARWLALYRRLLALRREHLVPRLAGMGGRAGRFDVLAPGALAVEWRLGEGSVLGLWINLAAYAATLPAKPAGVLLHCEGQRAATALAARRLPGFSAACYLQAAPRERRRLRRAGDTGNFPMPSKTKKREKTTRSCDRLRPAAATISTAGKGSHGSVKHRSLARRASGRSAVRPLNPGVDLAPFFERVRRAPARVLMLDYDGTLAPFQVRPERATPYPGVEELLDAIMAAEASRVVIVTGRPVGDLVPLLNLRRRPELWGAHGWERLLPDGRGARIRPGDNARRRLDEGERRAREIARAGARVEAKPASVALHWRGASALTAARIREALPRAWEPLAADGDVELLPFDGGVELRARGCSKEHAVKSVLSETPADAAVAYLGDDATDEDAFRAAKPRGLAVLVRPEFRQTAADAWIRPPGGLLAFLRRWRDACGRP
jgi:malto-oligosyltrehalose trehalohydrolase/trehalose-phosphatase